jgi:phosphatidylserine/phosphatidylglycerophosphate/cardiolipin synthase-like enzyme
MYTVDMPARCTTMTIHARIAALSLCALLCGCAGLRSRDLDHAEALAAVARPTALDCDRADACAESSPLHALGDRALAESTVAKPVNYVEIVESGQDSLLGRINLIRSARTSIDVQTFIYSQDDSGFLFFNELLKAARRGVKVRLLSDQLFSLIDPKLLADLSAAHGNFQMRMYNPTFGRAYTSSSEYVRAILCCFRSFNQRMHTKLLLVDGRVGFTGGRNIDDRYFDWNPDFDFRDRDAVLAGPAVEEMERMFDSFWINERSVPIARLKDVAGLLIASDGPPLRDKSIGEEHRTPRVLALAAAASDQADIGTRLVVDAQRVDDVHFIADGPQKHDHVPAEGDKATRELRELIEGARTSVLIQTPYLVLTGGARDMFRAMHKRANPPQVTISSNSLAATDALATYALAYKYRRRYLRDLGLHLFELKPHPQDVPIDVAATGAPGAPDAQASSMPVVAPASDADWSRLRASSESRRFPGLGSGSGFAPLSTSGLRISLHAKSFVIDGEIGIIGSHNLTPRSDNYNTEGVLVFRDAAMAQRLQAAILRDTSPVNSWLISKRPHSPVSGLNGRINELFENLPLFDLWPFRYATSYQLNPGCEPVPPGSPQFHACWTPVGDFPEAEISFKAFFARVLTAFGAGLAPIL